VADDDQLVERLRDALQPTPAKPTQQGIDAVRLRADAGRMESALESTIGRRHRARQRLLVAVAAAAVIVAGLVGTLIVTRTDDGGSDRQEVAESSMLIAARRAADRLSTLLAQPAPDPAAVAAADDELRQAVQALPAGERVAIADRAAGLHAAAAGVISSGSTAPRPEQRVEITSVTANPDGTYRVDFEVSGFEPAPDGYQVAFSFDTNAAGPFPYAGPSPWGFDETAAALYDEVCAEVAAPGGQLLPGSGGCQPIP